MDLSNCFWRGWVYVSPQHTENLQWNTLINYVIRHF
jgi:hypothetical protein